MKTWLKCLGWLVWVSGCVGSGGPGSDTSTDWVETCKTQSECSNDRICGCGVCTHECERDADCEDVSPSAVCAHSQSACGNPHNVCVPDREFSWLDASDASTNAESSDAERTDAESTTSDEASASASTDGALPPATQDGTSTAAADAAGPAITTDITSEPGDAAIPTEAGAPMATAEPCVKAFDLSTCCVGVVATTASELAGNDCMVLADGADLQQVFADAPRCQADRCLGVDCVGLADRQEVYWVAERSEASACELHPGANCEDESSCSAEQTCALGQCVACEGLAYLERSAYTSTFEGAAEGCTTDADCVYFKRESGCEDLACEWQASTPIALSHEDAVFERVRADSTEICAASSTLGTCERLGDCIGDLGGLHELQCENQRCVVPEEPNPCTLDAYAPRAQLEVLDCGYIESIGVEEGVRDAAFDCILTAFDDCTPALLTTVDIDQEGQRYVVQQLIEPTDDACVIAKFTDSRYDPFGSDSSLERSTCTELSAGFGGSPPHAEGCTLQARCPFLTSWL